jgi:DNA-binding transcriptional ArsR family regulator
MADVANDLAGLDRVIHEPARLSILTALGACKSADFLSLQRLTGLTDGNLSSHLSKLEQAGLVRVDKQFVGKKPKTQVEITQVGRQAIDRHWKQLASLRKNSQSWKSER